MNIEKFSRSSVALRESSSQFGMEHRAHSSPVMLLDAVIVSDIHLGSALCQAESLSEFLERILHGGLAVKELILNGDVFDSIDFRRLRKSHWNVLSLLRKLSDRILITWVCGNHDGPAELVSQLLGVRVKSEHTLLSGGKSILILHGHVFDDYIDAHPRITWFADLLYRILQKIDSTHRIARMAKMNSKVFLRCARKVLERSIRYAAERNHDAVCCGHTHHAETDTMHGVQYSNSGCWTESPCTFLTIQNGIVNLKSFTSGSEQERVLRPIEGYRVELQTLAN